MKDYLTIILSIMLAVFLGTFTALKVTGPDNSFGSQGYFSYSSPTMATSSVGIYSQASVLTASSGRQFAVFCNDSSVSNNPIYLQLGATSTKPYGLAVAAGSCYEMNYDNLFLGTVYAIASTSTSTLLLLYK